MDKKRFDESRLSSFVLLSNETIAVAFNYCNYSSAGCYPWLRFTPLKTSSCCGTVNVAAEEPTATAENRQFWLRSKWYSSVHEYIFVVAACGGDEQKGKGQGMINKAQDSFELYHSYEMKKRGSVLSCCHSTQKERKLTVGLVSLCTGAVSQCRSIHYCATRVACATHDWQVPPPLKHKHVFFFSTWLGKLTAHWIVIGLAWLEKNKPQIPATFFVWRDEMMRGAKIFFSNELHSWIIST